MRTPVVGLTLFLFAVSVTAADAPEATVRYRQSVMKAIAADMNALGAITRGDVSIARRASIHADSIAAHVRDLSTLFPAQSSPDHVKSAAKPEVWSQSSEFRAACAKVESETAKLATLAKTNDVKALQAQYAAVGAACTSCHRRFRNQD